MLKEEVIKDLFNRILKVVACLRCRQIMEFLYSHHDSQKPPSIYDIQSSLNVATIEELKPYFRKLRQASIAEELMDINDPRTFDDPNFCRYRLTTIGKITVKNLKEFEKELFELFFLA